MIYIMNDSTDPYFNLALEEYLFNLDDENAYYWLWQNDNTIVIGKNQNAFREINEDFVRENKIKISRRITGGGAVYHDLGNLNFTFIVPSQGKRAYDFKRFTDKIIDALKTFGVQAEYSGRNDLLIDGKKFSGNAQLVGERKILHHGTLLFSTDTSVIEKCLTPSEEKIKSRGVGSVKSRVANLDVDIEEFKTEFIRREGGGARYLNQDDIEAVKKLRDTKFSTYEWIYGASPEFNYSRSIRFDRCGTISLSVNLIDGKIGKCKINGDFFGSGDVWELEKLLEGKDSVPEEIDFDYYFGNLKREDFLLLFKDLVF